jgi:hypothetical protein
METLYQKSGIISRVKKYFTPYIELLTKPSGHKLFLLLLAILSMQAVTSIHHIYNWFLKGISRVSLNAYYYLLTYTSLPLDKFASLTLGKAITLIDNSLKDLPVLLLIDDTLQAKFGTKFECYTKMFDHARHSGSSYLNGHCFVALAVCVPVIIGNSIKYLTVPVRFWLKGEDESKLAIASEMIRDAMKTLADIPTVILLCDSWYPKGEVLKTVESYANLELVSNVRVDTVIYDLPKCTGKRGRPAKKGSKLSIYNDLDFSDFGRYYVAVRTVMTNLFKNPVYMTVTATNLDNRKSYRLFLSTITPDKFNAIFSNREQSFSQYPQLCSLFPLFFYSFRWNIEVLFYEFKTFWSFGNYMLRSKKGIENFINIISLSYTCAKLIPFADEFFSDFSDVSTQTTKCAFAEAIRKELFFTQFVDFIETHHISLQNFHDFDISDFFVHSS